MRDVVLKEQRRGALIDDARAPAQRDAERVRRSGQKRGHAREVEHPGALGEVLVDEVPVLAAKLHRVPPAGAAERVGERHRTCRIGLAAAFPGPPKFRPPATTICGSPIGRVTPLPMPKSAGLSGAAGNVPPSRRLRPNRASFSKRAAEHVRFVEGQEARQTAAHVPEPRNAVALASPARFARDAAGCRRTPGGDRLPPALCRRSTVHRSVSTTAGAEPTNRGVPSGIEEVRARNQRNQLPNDRVGRRRALLVAEHEAVHVDALPLSESFVRGKEERPSRAGSGRRAMPPNWFRWNGCGSGDRELEEIARVERVVSHELERLAVERSLPDRVTMLTIAPDTCP